MAGSADFQMFDVHVTRDVMVAMRDGVRLATDIYRPAQGGAPLARSFPVLLERTPYDKTGTSHADISLRQPQPRSKPEVATAFAQAGYIVAVQDCRGRYGSEGVFSKYVREGEDGVDTLTWLLAQDWCNGKIGTYGLSYGAHVQAAAASLGGPGLSAMFLDSGGFSSAYHSGIRQGGAFEMKQATWAYKHAILSPASLRDPARMRALKAADIRKWFARLPWMRGDSPLCAAPEYEDYLFELWEHDSFGPYWRRPGLYARGFYAHFPDAATVHMSSWYDPYTQTAIENYQGTVRRQGAPVRLVLGPWTHGQRSVTHAGAVDFGARATLDSNIAPDYIALRLAWFDQHLKGLAAPSYLSHPVTLFVMGGGSGQRTAQGRLDHGGYWRHASDWPLPEAVPTPFHLYPSGLLACDRSGPGTRILVADPDDPVPTIGGAIASGSPVMEAGAFDQRETADLFGATQPGRALADREDVLVFQTDPLERDLEVIGPIKVTLWVSSDAPDADIAVKLIDVYPASKDWPDGFAMNVTHGILRLRFRDGFDAPQMMRPGEIYRVEVEAFPTANIFAAGHRIRLDVCGSNFPHFDINPNTGTVTGKRIATSHIHMGQAQPSCLILPVVPRR